MAAFTKRNFILWDDMAYVIHLLAFYLSKRIITIICCLRWPSSIWKSRKVNLVRRRPKYRRSWIWYEHCLLDTSSAFSILYFHFTDCFDTEQSAWLEQVNFFFFAICLPCCRMGNIIFSLGKPTKYFVDVLRAIVYERSGWIGTFRKHWEYWYEKWDRNANKIDGWCLIELPVFGTVPFENKCLTTCIYTALYKETSQMLQDRNFLQEILPKHFLNLRFHANPPLGVLRGFGTFLVGKINHIGARRTQEI